MPILQPSPWPGADLSDFGLTSEAANLSSLTVADLAQGLGVCRAGQAYLDWESLRYAIALYEQVEDQFSPTQLAALAHALIDLHVQAVLHIQSGMGCTQYAAGQLLDDALAARDRLPRCAALLRTGRIDRRRFHKIAVETDLVDDPALLAAIDVAVAAELGQFSTATAISERKTAELARRRVAEIDPDGARRRRENAAGTRTVATQVLPDGMARLTIVHTAENIELAYRTLDAVIAGLCPNDPRTKAEARSDAAAALLGAAPDLSCRCGREDCTARLDQVSIDARTARIVIHVLCQSATLEPESGPDDEPGRDSCGYLDGHGPISADHVRELAQRDDARIVRHDLTGLCEDTSHKRRPPRPATPDDPGGEHRRLRPEVPDDPADVFDWDPPADWFDHPNLDPDDLEEHRGHPGDLPDDPEGFPDDPRDVDTLIANLVAADPGRNQAAAQHDSAIALLEDPTVEDPTDSTSPAVRAPVAVISRTPLPSDAYRPTTLLDLTVRFLWGTCSVPGCEHPAYRCDLDHVEEYDQLFPHRGGPTCLCNLVPKCRFHHLVKTHLDGYIDELWLAPDGRYRTAVTPPGGITVESVAPNHWLLPQLDALRCTHQFADTVRTGAPTAADLGPQRVRTRTEAKHAWRRTIRNRNRREREADAAEAALVFGILAAIARIRDTQAAEGNAFDNLEPPPF